MRGKLLFVATIAAYYLWRPRMLQWGLLLDEISRQYFNGDEVILGANWQSTRGITIQATRDDIWPWLAQMGRDRTGFYGIDRLDNWNIPSVRYLRRNLAPLATGMILDNGLKVLEFVPREYLLVGGFDLPNDVGGASDVTILYQLESHTNHTRLLIRTRLRSDGLKGWVYHRLFEVLDFLLVTAQLRGIKERAEVRHPQIQKVDAV